VIYMQHSSQQRIVFREEEGRRSFPSKSESEVLLQTTNIYSRSEVCRIYILCCTQKDRLFPVSSCVGKPYVVGTLRDATSMLQRQGRSINRCSSRHGHAKPDSRPRSNRARKIDVRRRAPRLDDRLIIGSVNRFDRRRRS
jgi:hypothetical protein